MTFSFKHILDNSENSKNLILSCSNINIYF
nr:MAG TPA: hypothetical protein [Caudoviricetes sp.]